MNVIERLFATAARAQNGGFALLEDRAQEPTFHGYRELPANVLDAADHFADQGVEPGAAVLFPFAPQASHIFSFLGLLAAGAVPYSIPPRSAGGGGEARATLVERIATGFGVRMALPDPLLTRLPGVRELEPYAPGHPARGSGRVRPRAADDAAFVQWSSGSTARPKGVPITHGKLVTQLRLLEEVHGAGPGEWSASWLPLHHDMGLVGGLLGAFSCGTSAYLITPRRFLLNPLSFIDALSEYRVSVFPTPCFGLKYLLRFLGDAEPERVAGWDLSSVRHVFVGSDSVDCDVLDQTRKALAVCGLRPEALQPAYGMAEAVLCVTSGRASLPAVEPGPRATPNVSVGRPLEGFSIRIRDDDGRLVDDGALGEIEIRGGTLCDRYLDSSVELCGSDGYHRTGDLGFVRNEELYVCGRSGDRMKLAGEAFFASDIERAVEQLALVEIGRVGAVQDGEAIYVAVEIMPERLTLAPAVLQQRIASAILRSAGVKVLKERVVLVARGQLPVTTSGKLRRGELVEAIRSGSLRAPNLDPRRGRSGVRSPRNSRGASSNGSPSPAPSSTNLTSSSATSPPRRSTTTPALLSCDSSPKAPSARTAP